MKKILSSLIAMTTICLGVTPAYAEPQHGLGDVVTPVKNTAYYNSLTDEEVYEEFKECAKEPDSPFKDAMSYLSYDPGVINGIIPFDFATELNTHINYRDANAEVEIKFPEGLEMSAKRFNEIMYEIKDPEYVGIAAEDVPFPENFSCRDALSGAAHAEHIHIADYDAGGCINYSKEDAYYFMRLALTLYHSPAYNDYIKGSQVSYMLIDKGNSYIPGDADLNAELSINDAVRIMSHVSNSDKYPIYYLAAEISDIQDTGDGLSNMDALEIQRRLANIV